MKYFYDQEQIDDWKLFNTIVMNALHQIVDDQYCDPQTVASQALMDVTDLFRPHDLT